MTAKFGKLSSGHGTVKDQFSFQSQRRAMPKNIQTTAQLHSSADGNCSHEIKRYLILGKNYDKSRQHIKKQRHYFADKDPYSQSYGFSRSQVRMWELDHREGWVLKNWCFRTMVLEKTLESPLDCKEIKPVNSKGKSTLNCQDWYWSSNTLATWCEEATH